MSAANEVQLERPSYATSVVTRVERPDGAVYVKRLKLRADGLANNEAGAAKLRRELRILELLRSVCRPSERLGLIEVVEANPEEGVIVTKEVPGQPLQVFLERRQCDRDVLTALFLAGRWLRWFQSVPFTDRDAQELPPGNPHDLVQYCALRLDRVVEWGYDWPVGDERKRVLEALARIVEQCDEHDLRLSWCHADFAPGNILWDGRRLTPIDFTMAHVAPALVDLTHLIHRMEMLAVYFPWRRWPVAAWREAVLRGYGDPDLPRRPAYRAMMIRQHVCRLCTYVRRQPTSTKERIHNAYVRYRVRRRLMKLLGLLS